jgi:HTH-type transcriptional regulator/antitoxin HigA
MIRRGWLRFDDKTDDVDQLESEYLRFFRLKNLAEKPSFQASAARKSSDYNQVSHEEMAWLHRAWNLARLLDSPRFTQQRLKEALGKLQDMRQNAEELRRVPSVLREAGIRFVVVESFPKTKVDGASFRLNRTSPVVALSLRYDRIDLFWHTLMHELAHIQCGHDAVVDSEIDAADGEKPEVEQVADRMAAAFLVPRDQLADFVLRVKPFFSKKKIAGFAGRIGVHPGLVVGQLQHRGHISYAHNREMLVKVREIVASTALSDGWGDVAPA